MDEPLRPIVIDGHTEAFLTLPGSPTGSMNVGFHSDWRLDLDDDINLREVQPPGCNISCDYTFQYSCFEIAIGTLSLRLRDIRVETFTLDVVEIEEGTAKSSDISLSFTEDNRISRSCCIFF